MKNKDRFDTRCWRYRSIANPHEVIAELFSLAAVYHFRSIIGKLLYYAGEDKIFHQRSPADVLLYLKSIRSLIKAADALKHKKQLPANTLANSGSVAGGDTWNEFPRFLSQKEYANPYRVFRKFFKYRRVEQWVKDWEELVEAALSRNRGDLDVNAIAVYRLLVKLLEAAHVLNHGTERI
ncbi:MAG: hypothetical protein ACTHLE_06560 [Agriterribacter sp.]